MQVDVHYQSFLRYYYTLFLVKNQPFVVTEPFLKSIALIAKYILQDIFVDPSITMRDITH